MINTSTNNKKNANLITKILLERKLSPCITISPKIESNYIWKSKITFDKEYILNIKTIKSNEMKIIQTINKYHTYDTPEIISYKININEKKYLDWFKDNIS